jgi:hypothetical protein
MDTRVGFGALSVLAEILEEEIKTCVDERGGYIGDPQVILNYTGLRKYLDENKDE